MHPKIYLKNNHVNLEKYSKSLGFYFNSMFLTFTSYIKHTAATAKKQVNLFKALVGTEIANRQRQPMKTRSQTWYQMSLTPRTTNGSIFTYSKTKRFKMVPGWSRCSQTPLATSTSSTMVSTASIMFIKNWCGACLYTIFQEQIYLMVRVIKMLSWHLQRPQQAQPWRVQQEPVMFIKNWHGACLCNFSKTNLFQIPAIKMVPGRIQDYQDDLRHIQRPKHVQPWEVEQVPVMFTKNYKYCLYPLFSKTNQFKCIRDLSLKILYKHAPCQFLMIINGTYCTPHGWPSRSCWRCPETSWSLWNHFK